MNSVKMTLLSMSSCSSVDRAPAQCSGGHGFDPVGNPEFSLSHARVMLINSSFTLLLSTKFTIFIHLSTKLLFLSVTPLTNNNITQLEIHSLFFFFYYFFYLQTSPRTIWQEKSHRTIVPIMS